MRDLRLVAMLALAAGMTPGLERLTSTYTMPHQEPDNRGRAEKDAAKLAKAEEKRKRRAAKRLVPNAKLTSGALTAPKPE